MQVHDGHDLQGIVCDGVKDEAVGEPGEQLASITAASDPAPSFRHTQYGVLPRLHFGVKLMPQTLGAGVVVSHGVEQFSSRLVQVNEVHEASRLCTSRVT